MTITLRFVVTVPDVFADDGDLGDFAGDLETALGDECETLGVDDYDVVCSIEVDDR